MRGKDSHIKDCVPVLGITPAYAGKSRSDRCRNRGTEDHPRLCGEKVLHILLRNRQSGSPPPMRGKVLNSEVSLRCYGITPAYAGKSFTWVPLPFFAEDHPRLCGEKLFCKTTFFP